MSVSSSTTSSEANAGPSEGGRDRRDGFTFVVAFVFTLSLTCGLAAAVNVGVDPFGYFGLNQTGLFFNDERSFKLNQVRHYPHDALILGDSRIAYVDPEPIRTPRFFNAGFGGASLEEVVWFWEHYSGSARLVVVGMLDGDVIGAPEISEEFTTRSWRDPLRYALSFELLKNSLDAVQRRQTSAPPEYRDNGARGIADKYIRHLQSEGTPSRLLMTPFVPGSIPPITPVQNLCAGRPDSPSPPDDVPEGMQRIGRMAALAEQRGAKLILFLQPRPRDVLTDAGRTYSGPHPERVRYICQLGLDYYDLTESYSDPSYYWSTDRLHYFPHVGVALLAEILRASGVQVGLQ